MKLVRRKLLITGAAVVILGGAIAGLVLLAWGSSAKRAAAANPLPPATAQVTRTTLVETRTVAGTLTYGDPVPVSASGTGTITWIAPVGSTVARGEPLFEVDGQPVVALYGSVPLYRPLHDGVKGPDVQQLEENLAELGYTGFTVDDMYAWTTAEAVRAWQADLGLLETGTAEAELDRARLQAQVAQAELALEQARLKLEQLKERPGEVEVAAAQASYDSALSKYEGLKASPKPEDAAAAEAAVRDAEVALANAQSSLILTQKSATVSRNVRDRENEHNWYEATYGETLAKFERGEASQADVDRDWSNLLTAKERLDTARADAEMALRKAENDVVRAEESLQKARGNLEQVLAGPTADQLKSAEAAMLCQSPARS